MRNHLCLLACLLFLGSYAHAQTVRHGLPKDLDKETMVFVKYDQLVVPADLKGRHRKIAEHNITAHNEKKAPVANQQLEEEVKNYPFNYKVIQYSELATLKDSGYKYVFMFDPITWIHERALFATGNTQPLLIKDLHSGDTYELKEFSSTFVYAYKNLIRHLNGRVKHEYRL